MHLREQAPAFTGSLYLRTDDVDGMGERLEDRAVFDNNGYLLQFGQDSKPR